MDSLMEMIINTEITPKELISWLSSSSVFPLLSEYENIKADFVPYFLNFLREQTSSIMKSSSHTGLTPNKSTSQLKITKYNSPNKFYKKTTFKKGFCSKAKTLNFVDDKVDDAKNAPLKVNTRKTPYRTPQKSPAHYFSPLLLSESPVTVQSYYKSYKTSTPREDQHKTYDHRQFDSSAGSDRLNSTGHKSGEKKNLSLGDYLVVIDQSEKKSHKKKTKECSNKDQNLRVSEKPFNLEDKDAFPVIGCKNDKKDETRTRRINPTRVVDCEKGTTTECKKLLFGVPSKSAKDNFFLTASESEANSVDQERKLLKQEIDKMQKSDGCNLNLFAVRPNSTDQSRSSVMTNKSTLNTIYDEDSLSLVTFQKELQILSIIYSSLILCNMVSNILVELYFILQLLTAKEDFIEELADNKFLNSPHNCIYFSVKTLSHLTGCLSLFDRSFIKALSDNPRVCAFDPAFKHHLLDIIECTSIAKSVAKPHSKSPILGVSFQSETDNKNNFPDTLTFQNFKKQRDLFYELLRIWEDSHLIPGWTFNQGLGHKLNQIFSLQNELTNLTHLARLFQCQLLTMCKGDEQVDSANTVEDMSFLCQLRKQHPEKFKRLYERLITPSKFGGPVPIPSFPGSQEFFKDFILNAANHSFNVHLRNVLITKITELNNINCQLAELEDEEHGDHLKDEITSRVQSLRLLAKFLGFIEFFPYQTNGTLPDLVVDNQLALRNKVVPPIPLLKMLKEGVLSGCLVVVIPWMVELLSMVDSVALHTQYYLTLIFELILIYKVLYLFKCETKQTFSCSRCDDLRKLRRQVSCLNSLFLKLLIGWLLSLPNVPEGLFYIQEDEVDIDSKEFQDMKRILSLNYCFLCSSCVQLYSVQDMNAEERQRDELIKEVLTIDSSPMKMLKNTPMKVKRTVVSPFKTPSKFFQVSMIETPEGTPDKENDKEKDSFSKLILDSYDLIDYNTILLICPFVHELKEVLNEFSLGSFRSVNGSCIRKITPMSAPEKVEETREKSIQNILEENFFHNQTSSTKKTVDFLVERIFANVLRSLRSVVIPSLKDGCTAQLRKFVNCTVASTPPDKTTETVDKHVQQLSNELSIKVRHEITTQMNSFLDETLLDSLKFLLPLDITQNSQNMCCEIVKRIVKEKVSSWVNSHLTTGFCTNELITEAHKYLKQAQKAQNNDSTYNLETSLASNGNFSSTNLHNNSSTGLGSILEDQPSLDLSSSLNTNLSNIPASKDANKEYTPRATIHHKELIFPSKLLSEIKNDLKKLMVPSENAEEAEIDVECRLLTIKQVMEERQDLTLTIVKALQTLSSDWMAALCVCRPRLVTKEILKRFVDLWMPAEEGLFPNPSILCVFLSSRSIMLLGQKEVSIQCLAWQKLEAFLMESVINCKIISPTQLQDALVALLRENWPQSIYDGLSTLIRRFVDTLGEYEEFSREFESVQFIEWVSWFTSDMDV